MIVAIIQFDILFYFFLAGILEQHRLDMQSLEEAMLSEQYRQKQILKVRLEKRSDLMKRKEFVRRSALLKEQISRQELEDIARERDKLRREVVFHFLQLS